MRLTDEILSWYDDHRQEAYDLLIELAQIPAPSNHEEKRAEFCKRWLEAQPHRLAAACPGRRRSPASGRPVRPLRHEAGDQGRRSHRGAGLSAPLSLFY